MPTGVLPVEAEALKPVFPEWLDFGNTWPAAWATRSPSSDPASDIVMFAINRDATFSLVRRTANV